MNTKHFQKKYGFTLLELVIIVIIVVLVGAMVAPFFVRAHNNNVRIANQANIRAAMEAAEREFISESFETKYEESKKDEIRHFTYYRYNTSTQTIDRLSIAKREDGIPLGVEASEQAKNNKVCSFIMVYAGYGDENKLELMTAPFYDENGKVLYYTSPYGKTRGTD